MGLSGGGKSFRIGLAVLIQYWSVAATQPASHPASHVAVAITLNAKASSLKIESGIVQKGSNLHCTVISSCKFSLDTCVNKMRLTTARFCAIPPCSIIYFTTLSAFGTWSMDILHPCSSPNPCFFVRRRNRC